MSKEFIERIRNMDGVTIDGYMEIANETGVFDDYDEPAAIERDKRVKIRHLVGEVRNADGDREIRSWKDGTHDIRIYINVRITSNTDALKTLINDEEVSIKQHTKIRKFLARRRQEVIGQLMLDGYEPVTAEAVSAGND